ncbi:MAG: hypothetical protein ISS82_06055 [Nanoarchaeota archaeon]|nr:hypothetical protein [Nanoarchaeota archaeon]
MKLNKNHILVLIFLLVLAFSLYVNFGFNCFSDAKSYFNIRLIENVKDTGMPLLFDPLSYSGVNIVVPQLFHYLIALFSFIPFYLKIFPVIISSFIVFVVYLISKEITKNEVASLLTALLSGFIPIYFTKTMNTVSVYSLMIPFMFLLFYFLIRIEKKKYLRLFLLFSFLLPLIGASSFLFIFSLVFYVILSISEGIKIDKLKKEAILFSFFVILLMNLILFKKAFFVHGFNVVFGNVPHDILLNYFNSFNVFSSIYLIGVLSFFFGIVGVYFGVKERKDSVTLLISLILSTLLLLFLKLINLNTGLLFLAVGLTIISSLTISNFFVYLSKTKLNRFKTYFVILFILLIFVFSVLPSFYSLEDCRDLNDFYWIKNNLEGDAVILAPLEYGHYITEISERRNVIDSNFLLVKDIDDRFNSINIIYNTWSETKALELLHEYDVDYIYVDDKNKYNLIYLEDENCFKEIKEKIYEVAC